MNQSSEPGTYLKKDLIQSPAFLSLAGTAPQVLLLFMLRRQLKKSGFGKRQAYVITNNGEIVFTYIEAKDKWGISRPRFKRAIEQLTDRGFIDIRFRGTGLQGSKNLYAISERWKKYGTDSFEPHKELAKHNNHGFQPGHPHYNRGTPGVL